MCGIFAICAGKKDLAAAQTLSHRQAHRGPDFRGHYSHPTNGHVLCHERLAIIDLSCTQPLQGSQPDKQVVHNGEIYNYEALRDTVLADYHMKTTCDSEVIIFLWEKFDGPDFCNMLDGDFAFALIDGDRFMAARDPIGVKPLYYGVGADGTHYFSSEMKVIIDDCDKELHTFPPGFYFTRESGFVRYYQPAYFDHLAATGPLDLAAVRDALINATHKRLMSDVPLGLLLSGGLDSSLTSAIAMREMKRQGLGLLSFSIGLDASAPDLVAARKVAAFLGTEHHEIHFTVEQGLAVLDKLIWHLETYDVTSVRASTPMYLLSEVISSKGIKVVLSGEGADEIFGGYLYFHNAPNDEEFQRETIRRVQLLSTADCLRADKSCMAHSIEVRVPFLDRNFLDVAMTVDARHKRPKVEEGLTERPIEKWILRKAFDDPIEPYLPREILWRQKEQFSDGVGYNWIDQMMAFCSAQVTDQQMSQAADRFPHNTPATKEAYYIRSIFEKHFPGRLAAETVLKWVPKWQANTDPSGRASQFHLKSVIERVDSNSSANESAGSEWSLQLDDAAAESLDQVAAPVDFAHATPVFV